MTEGKEHHHNKRHMAESSSSKFHTLQNSSNHLKRNTNGSSKKSLVAPSPNNQVEAVARMAASRASKHNKDSGRGSNQTLDK